MNNDSKLEPPSDGWLIGIGRKTKGKCRDLMIFVDEEDGMTDEKAKGVFSRVLGLIREWEEENGKGN